MKKIIFVLVSIILLYSCQSTWSQSKMRKGPYLIYTGVNTQMKVLWQLDSTLSCTIEWGLDTNSFSNSTVTTESGSGTDEHQHYYIIDGLIPETKYYYRVTENTVAHTGSFTTAPYDTTTCITFYAYGDTRTNPNLHDSLCEQMITEVKSIEGSQSIILHAGDWNTYGNEWRWDNEFFNRNYSNLLEFQSIMPIMGTRGNHEDSAVEYHKYWPYDSLNLYYSFDYGPIHFTVIDQYVDFVNPSAQYTWIENDLANTTKQWKIVLLHEPAYTDESAHTNSVSTQTNIVPLCNQYGVQAIIGGHNHYYAHCLYSNIHHLTLGGGGAPLYNVSGVGDGLIYSESTLHFGKFSVCSDTMIIEIIRPDGTIVETLNIPVNITKLEELSNPVVNVYPNPANEEVSFEINGLERQNIRLKVIDINGKTVFNKKYRGVEKGKVNISKLDSGVYSFHFKGSNFTVSKKVVLY